MVKDIETRHITERPQAPTPTKPLPPLDTPIAHNRSPECPVHDDTSVDVEGGHYYERASVVPWECVTTFKIVAYAPADMIVELEVENAALKAFIADFADAKFEALRQPYCPDPQDEEDPVTEALTVWAWQEDARATLKGTSHV